MNILRYLRDICKVWCATRVTHISYNCFCFPIFSDALEKFRYLSLTGSELNNAQRSLDIFITTDKNASTLTIQVLILIYKEILLLKYLPLI